MFKRGISCLLVFFALSAGSCASYDDEFGGLLGLLFLQGVNRTILINNSFGTVNDFPLLVKLNASDAAVDFSRVNDDGSNVCFYDPDGTPLAFEIETWNNEGLSTFWVRVPEITGNSLGDSIIMNYGSNGGCSPNPALVWDDNYRAVWHMNNDPDSSQILDSKNTNHGVPQSMTSSSVTETTNGTGLSFDGSSQWISVADNANLRISPTMTIEALVRWEGPIGSPAYVVEKGYNDADNYAMYFWNGLDCGGKTSCLSYEFADAGSTAYFLEENISSSVMPVSVWKHLTIVRESPSSVRYYMDGVLLGEDTSTSAAPDGTLTHDLHIGVQILDVAGNPDYGYYFTGIIDELRLSSSARSADWIALQSAMLLTHDTVLTYQ